MTGASGYVGGHLLRRLETDGMRVRCVARRPERLASKAAAGTEVVRADCLDPASLGPALAGIRTAFYLVHSMGGTDDFVEQDQRAAQNFGAAARAAAVTRIIYLGGLGSRDGQLSRHLRSRHQSGELLRESGVPVIEFRASIILGAGSTSFELVQNLIERLPVLICPRWVSTLAQPIAIDDVISYLVAALDLPEDTGSRIFEIGGADRVSYGDLMRIYARRRGLRRLIITVPVLTPWLSALWLALVTPTRASVGRELIEGVRYPTVVQDDSGMRTFQIRPRGVDDAMSLALARDAAATSRGH